MSTDSLNAAGSAPVAVETPVAASIACCGSKWRTGFQVPLLLFAAGGLGFAGHQISQSPDFQELLTGQPPASSCSFSKGHCPSHMLTAEANSAAEGCCASAMAHSQACAMADVVAESVDEAAGVSALTPANLASEETDIGAPATLETL
jgi:hypothetical protein